MAAILANNLLSVILTCYLWLQRPILFPYLSQLLFLTKNVMKVVCLFSCVLILSNKFFDVFSNYSKLICPKFY